MIFFSLISFFSSHFCSSSYGVHHFSATKLHKALTLNLQPLRRPGRPQLVYKCVSGFLHSPGLPQGIFKKGKTVDVQKEVGKTIHALSLRKKNILVGKFQGSEKQVQGHGWFQQFSFAAHHSRGGISRLIWWACSSCLHGRHAGALPQAKHNGIVKPNSWLWQLVALQYASLFPSKPLGAALMPGHALLAGPVSAAASCAPQCA